VKKGIAVLLTVQDGVLRETVCPQLVIAQTHRKRADTRAWLKEEVDFGGMKLDRLLTLFNKLADGYDGLIRKSSVRAALERCV
jgi:hypothetical protein